MVVVAVEIGEPGAAFLAELGHNGVAFEPTLTHTIAKVKRIGDASFLAFVV